MIGGKKKWQYVKKNIQGRNANSKSRLFFLARRQRRRKEDKVFSGVVISKKATTHIGGGYKKNLHQQHVLVALTPINMPCKKTCIKDMLSQS